MAKKWTVMFWLALTFGLLNVAIGIYAVAVLAVMPAVVNIALGGYGVWQSWRIRKNHGTKR